MMTRPVLPAHPKVPRALESNIELRIQGALEQVALGRYSLAKAARTWKVPYKRLYYRSKGRHPVAANGGNRTKLTAVEEVALWAWIHRRVTLGIHVRPWPLAQAVNELLLIGGRTPTATLRWAKRWLYRNKDALHSARGKARSTVLYTLLEVKLVPRFDARQKIPKPFKIGLLSSKRA